MKRYLYLACVAPDIIHSSTIDGNDAHRSRVGQGLGHYTILSIGLRGRHRETSLFRNIIFSPGFPPFAVQIVFLVLVLFFLFSHLSILRWFFFCHDMIRHETILFRSFDLSPLIFFVQGVTDVQRLGNINIRMWKVACDIPFSFFIFLPFLPLLFHRSTQSAQLENATSSMAIPWNEHEHNG